MSARRLIIEGARQNNLKDISLSLPHDSVIAVTGVSGSGKSSLAFDTIFAEGQWRFIESLSTYARLFLEKLDRPAVDSMQNIRPSIALEQRNPVRGSRSTVGTLTEIYDLMRLLYSKVSTPFCPSCGEEIRKWDPSQIVSEILEKHAGKRAFIIFGTDEPPEELMKKGFRRLWVDGEAFELAELMADRPPALEGRAEVVLDRLVIRDEPRLADSVENAWRWGNQSLKVAIADGQSFAFTALNACDICGREIPEPSPLLFSFNHPVGACPECKGFGNVLKYDEGLIVPDTELSLSEGAVEPWEKPSYTWWKGRMLKAAPKAGIETEKPYRELSQKERLWLFGGARGFSGINDFFEELESKRYKLHVRVFLSRYRKAATCPLCEGKRLRKEALSYKISGLDIAGLSELRVSDMMKFLDAAEFSPFERQTAGEPLGQIGLKLGFLKRVGLEYLSLSRLGKTLSGGEYQRVNLSNQLASCLTGTLYVLDEPTVGLHARDTERVSEIMAELSRAGNTLVVVEHDRQVINSSDWVVELGPGGGRLGGNVVFSGPIEEFLVADTVTSRYAAGKEKIKPKTSRKKGMGSLLLRGARGNNLKGVDFEVPLRTMTSVTGVSGSGKSTLVVETLYRALARHFRSEPDAPLPFKTIEGLKQIKNARLIDQSPIGKSPRSNPVTYLKAFDHIRRLFAEQPEAKAHGFGPGFFSFNVPGGRCETCGGEGHRKIQMYFFEDLYVKCEECGGLRYGPEALRVAYRGKAINDVLEMTVDEAAEFFGGSLKISQRLNLMKDIGLGYLRLGQPATTLSGGEAQRLKICAELGPNIGKDVLYVLDEPTVGLHPRDVSALLAVLNRLVDAGNTVLVIEHHMDVINASDWIVDLGPEGGDGGGGIVFSGTPEGLQKSRKSHTGRYLREHLRG